jgi:D-alanine-D-alanine ligase-like ATP-grasp enzyme
LKSRLNRNPGIIHSVIIAEIGRRSGISYKRAILKIIKKQIE